MFSLRSPVLRLERSTLGRDQRREVSTAGDRQFGPVVAHPILRERRHRPGLQGLLLVRHRPRVRQGRAADHRLRRLRGELGRRHHDDEHGRPRGEDLRLRLADSAAEELPAYEDAHVSEGSGFRRHGYVDYESDKVPVTILT